jgi:uncharacterized membrane-anchored protein
MKQRPVASLPPGRLIYGTREELAAIVGPEAAALAQSMPGEPGRYVLRVRSAEVAVREVPPAPVQRRWFDAIAALDGARLVIALLAFLATLASISVAAIAITGMVTTAIVGMVAIALPTILGAVIVVACIVVAFTGGGKEK